MASQTLCVFFFISRIDWCLCRLYAEYVAWQKWRQLLFSLWHRLTSADFFSQGGMRLFAVKLVPVSRCRSLQETGTDATRLRTLSGAWFSEERSKRHRNRTSGSALVHSTIQHRKTKSRGQFPVNVVLLLLACGAVFPTVVGISQWNALLVVIVTDVPLAGLFNGEIGETSHNNNNNNTSPEAERRLTDSKEEESEGLVRVPVTENIISLCVSAFSNICCFFRSQGISKPTPTPRTKAPVAQVCVVCTCLLFFLCLNFF